MENSACLNESVIGWLKNAIDSKNFFIRKKFLDENGWIAIPVESACHFDDEDAKRISQITNGRNLDRLNAVSLEDLAVPRCIEIGANVHEVLKFSLDFGHFNYALFPSDHSFLLVCTTDDYFSVAGKPAVVEHVVGNSVDDARKEFSHYANDENWPIKTKLFLNEVSDWYLGGE